MGTRRSVAGSVSFDVLLLFILLVARVRIDTLAEWAAIPSDMLHSDVARLLGGVFSPGGLALLADRQTTDAVTLLLISAAFLLFIIYVLVDILGERWSAATGLAVKIGLVVAIIVVVVFGQTALFIGLRHISGPASYTHDGGVIQTEAATEFFMRGINPYVADYVDTPMAAWGTEYRTALYHYPYLPWTFVFSTPFYILSHLLIGWYDQRFVYLALFAIMLALAAGLTRDRRSRLGVLMVLGLNPILSSDMIFGQNDSFVLFWLLAGIWYLHRAERNKTGPVGGGLARGDLAVSMALFGLAFASKPTAWFIAPFLLLFLAGKLGPLSDQEGWLKQLPRRAWQLAGRVWPLVAVFVLLVGPWLVWNAAAMYDDVWGWSSGTSATPYQIRGWGLSNFVLALQWVPDRLAYWPFWITELVAGLGLLVMLGWRQLRHNNLPAMVYHYAVLLFGFLYASRFLNENYLGFVLSLLALAYFVDVGRAGAAAPG